jgi:site-specific DNA-methyltransferase (adenine-specific)
VTELPRNIILMGDAHERLHELPSASVDCVITSPPYFQLRNYHADGQLGLEPHVDGWVAGRRAFTEVARVLKPSGSLWLNLGDSFSRHHRYGAAPKGLLLVLSGSSWLLLMTAGWVRNTVAWAKTNDLRAHRNTLGRALALVGRCDEVYRQGGRKSAACPISSSSTSC